MILGLVQGAGRAGRRRGDVENSGFLKRAEEKRQSSRGKDGSRAARRTGRVGTCVKSTDRCVSKYQADAGRGRGGKNERDEKKMTNDAASSPFASARCTVETSILCLGVRERSVGASTAQTATWR